MNESAAFYKRLCKSCNSPIPITRRKDAIYCSIDCYRATLKERYHHLNPQSKLTNTASGAVSEYKVIIDLLIRGFEVFRSVEPGATCDLAILKNNKLLRVEVKTAKYSSSGKPFNPYQTIKADILALVLPDTIIYTPSLELSTIQETGYYISNDTD